MARGSSRKKPATPVRQSEASVARGPAGNPSASSAAQLPGGVSQVAETHGDLPRSKGRLSGATGPTSGSPAAVDAARPIAPLAVEPAARGGAVFVGRPPLKRAVGRAALALLFALYLSPLALDRVRATAGLWGAWLGAGLVVALGLLAVHRRGRAAGRLLPLAFVPRTPHLVQLAIQGSVYVYWGAYAEAVYPQLPLIAGQAVLGMLIEVGLGWWRHGEGRLSFGAWPIVGSINLFLWFHDPVFIWQFAVLFGAYASRELLRWRRDGQVVHIFNPSALPLTVAAVVLIGFGWVHHTAAPEISTSLGLGPFSFEQMFLAAVVGQLLYGVTLIPMAATLTMIGLDHLWFAQTGGWFFLDASVPVAVFLSMNLLITDPVTSPRTPTGKVLFGALYGVGVMALYLGLRALETPPTATDPGLKAAFFDKLLHVPLLNLAVVFFDRVGRRLPLERLWGARPGRPGAGLSGLPLRALQVALWALAFWWVRPQLVAYPGASSEFWRAACAAGQVPNACGNLLRVLSGPCSEGDLRACNDLAGYFAQGLGGPPNAVEAEVLWTRACAGGVAVSCDALGEAIMARGGDPTQAAGYFGQACAGGLSSGCTRAGIVAVQIAQSAEDRRAGIERLAQGCRLNDGLGCDLWGGELLNGMPPEPVAAADLFDQACKAGHHPGCVHLADLLRLGFGVPKDPVRASKVLEPACLAGEAEACAMLGALYDRGEGVPADLKQAARFHGLACRGGVVRSCRGR